MRPNWYTGVCDLQQQTLRVPHMDRGLFEFASELYDSMKQQPDNLEPIKIHDLGDNIIQAD